MMSSLADYITHIRRDGTYGDQITLYAAANLYNIDIQLVSSLGLVGSMCSVRQQVFQQYAAANLYNIDIQLVSSLGLVGSMCSVRQQVFQQLPCTLDIFLRTKANNV